jgi:hypothetical protein
LGFLGVVVYTRVHTPRFCGDPASAGTLLFAGKRARPLRTNWLIVGIVLRSKKTGTARQKKRPPRAVQRTADFSVKRELWSITYGGKADFAPSASPDSGSMCAP